MKDTKEEKKNKKKDMAPPKSTPKGNKLIASMPHPSPLDQVGSPPSGSGKGTCIFCVLICFIVETVLCSRINFFFKNTANKYTCIIKYHRNHSHNENALNII